MTSTFDNHAARYSDEVQSSISFSGLRHDFFLQAKVDVLARTLRRNFGAAPPGTALDIGCGVGLLHPYIEPLFGKLTGADISAASIEQAQRLSPSVAYSMMGESLPYDDGAFDVTLTVCVLHHVPPERWDSFTREMRRVTRPGGLVCVIEHNPFNPLTQLAISRCSFDADAVLLRASKTRELLRKAGAKKITTEFFLTLPARGGFFGRLGRLAGRLPIGAQYLTAARA
ncbi:MAG: methyltransferase domain-containing protein [Methylovirgula sp.]|uniref:class I SAM-dependent methyltransferase n=1 Tax=Methylovirgula sp. TaxID=1978224 RepID=UPI00307660AE